LSFGQLGADHVCQRLTIFTYGELDRDIFEKISGKIKEEIRVANGALADAKIKLSNPTEFI
jgi:hypothetical protein